MAVMGQGREGVGPQPGPSLDVRLALDQDGPAELAGEDDQRAVEHPALFEVEHGRATGASIWRFQIHQPRVAVVVRVPVKERGELSVVSSI